ncbi:MAG: hypothetical protein ACRDRW_20820 [Pseudonocardiaceae bacterium]
MHDEPATPGARGDSPGRVGREGGSASGRWRQHAAFSVFVDSLADDAGRPVWRTRLYHEETGEETTVPGSAPLDWVRWIADRMGLVADPSDVGGARTETVLVEIKIVFGARAP